MDCDLKVVSSLSFPEPSRLAVESRLVDVSPSLPRRGDMQSVRVLALTYCFTNPNLSQTSKLTIELRELGWSSSASISFLVFSLL
jgi:hypothetical protein